MQYSKMLMFACSAAIISACGSRNERIYTEAQGTVDLASNVSVDDIEFGRALKPDNNVVAEMDEFTLVDTIYAAVRTLGAGTNVTLTARWMYRDTLLVHEETKTVSPAGNGYTSFRFMPATPLRSGPYMMVLLLNGRQADDEDFVIK
jgi:hypothetical protein